MRQMVLKNTRKNFFWTASKGILDQRPRRRAGVGGV